MLPSDTVRLLARRLYEARKNRIQLRHFSTEYRDMTIEDGYAIQSEWVRLEIADGRSVKGRKIGLTSRAMQQASQITEPDYAPLMDDMFFAAGSDIPIERFIAPRVEVELAFVLSSPLQGPGVTLFDVLRATDYVTPAIEIIDARIEQFDVVGGRPVKPDAVELRWVAALLYKNAVIEESGVAAAVLNHPAAGVAWLANKISPYGEVLRAADIILAGSFTRPTAVVRGDVLHADYGPLGGISMRFV
jgi:2-oxo-hept-3-ene-1,7-dioate hydratase